MKRIIAAICSLTLLVLLCSCGSTRTAPAAGSQRLSVVATIFPEYDWASQVLGERAGDVELTLLLDSGVDLHSFQPSAKDMVTISGCDLFIYVGGESDHWVEAALAGTSNPNRIVINLMELLGQQVKPVNLGTRNSFADIAATVTELLGVPFETPGISFAQQILR